MKPNTPLKYLVALTLLILANQELTAQVNIQSSKDPFALHTDYYRKYRVPQGSYGYRRRSAYFAPSFWKEDDIEEAKGKPRIEISLSGQVARFFIGEELVGQAPISSGQEGYDTKAGSYQVLAKEIEHFSNLYGSFIDRRGRTVGYGKASDCPPRGTRYEPSPMPYFLRLDDAGLGMHAGLLPGYRASHGCIRLPRSMAKHFFHAAEIGTPVEIVD